MDVNFCVFSRLDKRIQDTQPKRRALARSFVIEFLRIECDMPSVLARLDVAC